MNIYKKTWFLALIALFIAIIMGIYQRRTGPTYPQKILIKLDETIIRGELPRSGITGKDQRVELDIAHADSAQFVILYRRYQFDTTWTEIPMKRQAGKITAYLPSQPPAGKLEYAIALKGTENKHTFITPSSVIIRFKGAVPDWVLIIHIFSIFTFMIFSNFMALSTLIQKKVPEKALYLTLAFLIVGGLIMGPIVQKYAFGAYWTGFPFGYDLTDNKVLIAFIAWIWAFYRYKARQSTKWIYVAAVITFIIFVIPHSALGSTLDYSTMKVVQG
jgi:hypothetical protein